jgi:hypothetical protein
MKVITSYPIYLNNKQVEGSNFYLNADAEQIGKIATEGLGAVAGIATAINSQPKSGIKQACGRKPLFGKAKKKAWQDCVDKYNAPQVAPVPVPVAPIVSEESKPMSKNLKMGLIIGGGLLLVGIIIFAIRKKK